MTVAITLMESYMIETLLAKGMSKSELIANIQNQDSANLNAYDDTFDYAELIAASKKEPKRIEQAIQTGYTIKYISKFGINRLLQLKFGLQEGTDYRMDDAKFFGISLNEEQFNEFTTLLSAHWHIVNQEKNAQGKYQFDILHATEYNHN